jgi:hypothetical protein
MKIKYKDEQKEFLGGACIEYVWVFPNQVKGLDRKIQFLCESHIASVHSSQLNHKATEMIHSAQKKPIWFNGFAIIE